VLFAGAHYRSPVEFSDEAMEHARAQADTFRNYFVGLRWEPGDVERDRLADVLDDDFNTADALAVLHDWRARGESASLAWGLELLGLGSLTTAPAAPDEIRELAERRLQARKRREFTEADRLREEIARAGWEVRDVSEGFQLVPK
jgi:cysteinyl-tRNA synthetase